MMDAIASAPTSMSSTPRTRAHSSTERHSVTFAPSVNGHDDDSSSSLGSSTTPSTNQSINGSNGIGSGHGIPSSGHTRHRSMFVGHAAYTAAAIAAAVPSSSTTTAPTSIVSHRRSASAFPVCKLTYTCSLTMLPLIIYCVHWLMYSCNMATTSGQCIGSIDINGNSSFIT
jgi:hypothetical protein